MIARPRFIDEHMHGNAGVVGVINRRGGGAPIDARQPSGVAVGQNVDRLAGLFGGDVFLMMSRPCAPMLAAHLNVVGREFGGVLESRAGAVFQRN